MEAEASQQSLLQEFLLVALTSSSLINLYYKSRGFFRTVDKRVDKNDI